MSVFEYSSVFIAIIVGQTANELLQRMAHIMKQDRWIRLYKVEMFSMCAYLVVATSYFFGYFAVASNLNEITIFSFLGPIIAFSLLYFLAYFAPVPHPRENISDIEVYFVENLPKSQILFGIYVVVNPVIQALTLDSNLLFEPYYQAVIWPGVAYTLMSFVYRPAIEKFGIQRTKIGGVLFVVIWLTITLENPLTILTGR